MIAGEHAETIPNSVIEGRGLGKTYPSAGGKVEALRDIDITLIAGEFIAFLGASGSGKSTLINILSTLDTPTSGTLTIEGKAVGGLSDHALSRLRNRKIGFVFQGYNLLPALTAKANVELPCVYAGLGRDEASRRADVALAKVGLAELGARKPNELSGGQQQRVAFARALVLGAAVLFADEPTGALDSVASANILALCLDLSRSGFTVAMVTHDRQIADHASRIVTLADGRIVSDESAGRQ